MNRVDLLTSLLRRLSSARELNDLLVLETLELCSQVPVDDVPKKYVLTALCAEGAWEQAAIWVMMRCFPSWTLELRLTERDSTARLLSPHRPPFKAEVTNARAGTAILSVQVQTLIGLTKLRLDSRSR